MLMPLITETQLPAEIVGYCVKCKASRKMVATQPVDTKNGKPAARGKCLLCGTAMMKLLPVR